MKNSLICWFMGHDWSWIFDGEDFQVYQAGNCLRCKELGDGLTPLEPDYPQKEYSEGITHKGFAGK